MANKGNVELILTDAAGGPITDGRVGIRIMRADGRTILDKTRLRFAPPRSGALIKDLPAFPQASHLYGRVTPTRYHRVRIPHFMLTDGKTKQLTLALPRRVDKWKPAFTTWASLPRSFRHFKKVLDGSKGLRLKGPEKAVATFEDFTGHRDYDLVHAKSQVSRVLAKAALLNVRFKMTDMADPTSSGTPWFQYVNRIIEVRRDRFIAEVDPTLGESLRKVHEKIGDFPEYERTMASNHHVNMPHDLFDHIPEEGMLSIKSSDRSGNMQLTTAHAVRGDEEFTLLDADIDEKGTFFGHIFEVLDHKLTGDKTHPFDVHELLVRQNARASIGYDLVLP